MANLKIDPLKMANSQIDPSCYILKFGKYKNMLAVDVADIQLVNKKGQYESTGLKYMQWRVDQDWFKQADIVKSIIIDYLDEQHVDMGDIEQKEPEPPKKTKKKK